MIRKNPNSTFTVDIRQGRTKRHQKRFKSRQEAQAYERHFLAKLDNSKEWQPQAKDNRTLSALINLWYELHGITLKDGKRVKNRLLLISQRMGDPIANTVNNNTWVKYRAERLKNASSKTVNNEQGFIVAVYNKLFELDETIYPSPINKVKKIKITEKRLRYLSGDEIVRLLGALDGDTLIASKLCLSTGARWGEINRFESGQLVGNKITLNSKSTKQRTIPIRQELAQSITPPLMASEKFFKKGLKKAGIELDKGQNTHILRHTFASHFIINGGNVLVLQKILGHSDIRMTMIYAHLAPNHLNEAIEFAPVCG